MANQAGTLENIARTVASALEPLKDHFSVENADTLGIILPASVASQTALLQAIDAGKTSAAHLPELIEGLADAIDAEDPGPIIAKGIELIEEIVVLIRSVKEVADKLDTAASGLSAAERTEIQEFAAQLPAKIVDYLLVEYLENHSGATAAALTFLGLLERVSVPADPAHPNRTPHVRKTLRVDRLSGLLTDTGPYLNSLYNWGQSGFDAKGLFERLRDFLRSFDVPAQTYVLGGKEQFEAFLFALSENAAHGLDFEIRIPGVQDVSFEIPISGIWSAAINIGAEFDAGLSGSIQPPFQVALNALNPGARLEVDMALAGQDSSGPSVLFGEAEGTRIQADRVEAGIGLVAVFSGTSAEAEPAFFGSIGNGKVVIDLSGGDGFIQEVLSALKLEGNLDLSARWQPSKGLMLQGSGGIEVAIPTHIDLGVLKFNALYLALKIGTEHFLTLETSAGLAVNLGPLQASIERIGLETRANLPDDRDGNLGPLDLAFAFKPPNGVGLSIDAGVIKGGGYLFFDFDREEYAGALELVFSEWIALKAIGLITTKMPDGSKGFSLLVIITVEFGSGIQLGFGFTLLGVGGLLGLNRTARVEALKDGVRTGAVESVMFPQDVIANAPRIISDLRRFFPPVKDIFLVGPMAKIGWGTPTLISASLGIILEFPSVNITMLGVVKAALPDEDADILRLQVNFIGRIEPSNQLMWFYAELFDSRVLFITLEGGMGLLLNWGDNANFVLSVGGFHPRYSPPPLPFPEPSRLAANILSESWAKVRIEGYFAVTSNSVQFGARAELFFGLSEFKLDGHLGFDALFQFNPFFFSVSLSFSLSVKVFGVGLFSVGFSGLLEGPTPWHIKGKGKISVLFFSISVPFEHTWGESKAAKLEPIEVFPLVEKEFKALTNWEAVVPDSSNLLVSLRKLGEAETDQLVLHPVGKLRISQRKIPIDFTLDKVGNQRPADVRRVTADAAIPGGTLSVSERQEKFAIGQFKDLDEAGRLSSPAFQPLESGMEITVAGEQMKTSQAVKRVIRYETIIIDTNYKRYVKPFFIFLIKGFATLNSFLFGHFLTGSAVKKSILSQHHKHRMQPFEEVIHIQPDRYSVVFNSNNKPVDAGAAAFTSQAKALEYMQQHVQRDPNLADSLHVIPATEVNLAA